MPVTDPNQRWSRHCSRREALRLVAGLGGTALLAACGSNAAPTATAGPATTSVSTSASTSATSTSAPITTGAATTTTASVARTAAAATTSAGTTRAASPATASAAASPATATGEIVIVNSGAKLPTEPVTFRWVDSGDQKAFFFKQYFSAYHEAHPNITAQYDGLPWNEIAKVVPLGVQSGNAQDVFQLPLNVPAAQAVTEGWIAPLDDFVPDFAAWQQNFLPNTFLEGVTDFNGKTYVMPTGTNKLYSTLTLYNVAYLQQAGYDPASKPLTWDDFRAAAKKVTEQGKGRYFGVILEGNQTGRWASYVSDLGRMAGAPAGDNIDWRTGEYVFTSAEYLAAIELLLALKADGSIFPGSLSLNAPQARAQMPQGVAGMIL